MVCVVGDRGWWLWGAVPAYSGWLAWRTFGGVRRGMAGFGGQGVAGDGDGAGDGGGVSNRRRKLERRGGQKMQYR